MTRADALARGKAALAWVKGLGTVALLLVALAATSFVCVRERNRAGRAEAAAAAAAKLAHEQAGAQEHNVPVVEQVTPEAFRDFTARLLAENAELRQARDEALAAIPGAQVTGAVRATVEGAAHGKPRPNDAPPLPPGGVAGPSVAGATSSPATGGTCVGGSCLLAEGDVLELDLDALLLRGPADGHYLAGTMTASAHGEVLLRKPFDGKKVQAEETVEKAREPGWAYGLGGGLSGGGGLGALLVQTPPREIPLLHWPIRAWFLPAAGASQGLFLAGVSVEP